MTGLPSSWRNPRREIIVDPKQAPGSSLSAARGVQPAGAASAEAPPPPGGPMDPSSATKATLKVLGLCFILLLLVAAVTVSVAVLVRHSEATRQLRGCQERAANETAALADRVAELERERAQRAKQLEKLAQREKDLQRQLGQAKESRKRLNATVMGCLENVTRLDANLSALQNEMFTLQAEGMDVNSQNGALLAEMAQWREQVTGLEGRLAGAVDARDAAEAEKEACNARQDALQESLQSYLAEIASLQRRLQGRSSPSSSSRRRKG
ncbi:coiled-coil domain-containing protein 194 isoform X3 [Pogona vitticeps]